MFDACRDDPEIGYRFLVDGALAAGEPIAQRTAWKICSELGWWSSHGKKRGKNVKKPGPPVHDDRCAVIDKHRVTRHEFKADGPNQLWLGDITEHWTGEGKLYFCAIKDAYSNWIVGQSIDSRMKSSLAVAALDNAAARRGDVAGCVMDIYHRSQFRSRKFRPRNPTPRHHRFDGPRRPGRRQRGHGVLLRSAAEECPQPPLGRRMTMCVTSSDPQTGQSPRGTPRVRQGVGIWGCHHPSRCA
ncbi:MAG: DDE-type integrase/transposase/recombinase [Acidimicrobiales bacterium]